MNIKEYISSGILEAYVLGGLTLKEQEEVEKNIIEFPELKKELIQIEEAQEKLLMASAVFPKEDLKAKLFKKIKGSKPAANVVAINSGMAFWRFAAAAAITLAVISSYLAFDYWNKWRRTESDLNNLIAQNQKIAQDYNQVNNRLDQIENDLKVIENPEFKKVVMKGTPNAPQSLASVYWNEKSKEVYLSIQNMKSLAQENQYQLWAIIDGKPVDAGVFDGNIDGLIKMKEIGNGATTFAVTIEPRGGKSSPTLETMQVAGLVNKG